MQSPWLLVQKSPVANTVVAHRRRAPRHPRRRRSLNPQRLPPRRALQRQKKALRRRDRPPSSPPGVFVLLKQCKERALCLGKKPSKHRKNVTCPMPLRNLEVAVPPAVPPCQANQLPLVSPRPRISTCQKARSTSFISRFFRSASTRREQAFRRRGCCRTIQRVQW